MKKDVEQQPRPRRGIWARLRLLEHKLSGNLNDSWILCRQNLSELRAAEVCGHRTSPIAVGQVKRLAAQLKGLPFRHAKHSRHGCIELEKSWSSNIRTS